MKKFIEYSFYIIISMFMFVAIHNIKDKFERTQIKEISNLSISYSKNDPIGIMKHTKKAYKEPNKRINNLQVK